MWWGCLRKHWEKLKGKQKGWRDSVSSADDRCVTKPVRKESLRDLTLISKPWVRTQLKVQAFQLGENSWWYFCQHTRHLWDDCLSKGINRFIFLEKRKGKLTFVREFFWSIYKQRRIFTRQCSVEQTFHLHLAHIIKAAEYYCSEGTGFAFHHLVASVWQAEAHGECEHAWGRLAIPTPQQLVSPISSFGSLCCRTQQTKGITSILFSLCGTIPGTWFGPIPNFQCT